MSFKRPRWIALFSAIGLMLFGYAFFMMPPGSEGQQTLAVMIIFAGTVGFIVALIWCIIAAVVSALKTRRTKRQI